MLAALAATKRFGVRFGLERMQAALARLGHPERQLPPVIHIGGTNGKGSTAAFVESALRAAGLRTGLYTSPHLARFTERIRIDGAEIDRATCGANFALAWNPAEELTFFEVVTLLALVTFARANIDVLILEVGLGGRLDATNVVDPQVAAVTGVALDHQDVLGPTLDSIAAEKAGIFKPGRGAVVGMSGVPDAVPTLVAAAQAAGVAELVVVTKPVSETWPLGLAGAHQRRNAACALAILDVLERRANIRVDERARRAGLAAARWPGRLELVGDVLLDAAHNPDGAEALARSLPEGVVAVAGVSADKDVAGVIAPVAARARQVIATEAPHPRAMPASELAALVSGVPVTAEANFRSALALARQAGGPVVVFGSLFLVGAVRAFLLGEETDPATLQDPGTRR
jgi:dihydrofolate synthase / folylpolyglutamate synthase